MEADTPAQFTADTRWDDGSVRVLGVDFNVTQAVDGTKGIHAMIPKSIFK